MKKYSLLVKEDRAFREALVRSHQEYARQRMDLLAAEVKEKLKATSPAIYQVLRDSGVGGYKTWKGLNASMSTWLIIW